MKRKNNKMVNSTESKIYLFNIRKTFPEVINQCCGQWGIAFTALDLDCVTGNVKTENFT